MSGLACSGLTKRFPPDLRGIGDVSLGVRPGQAYALLGANGAGKTTLLNVLLGFLPPEKGSVSVGGIDVRAEPLSARRLVAYVPEVAALYPHLSALENIRFFDSLLGVRREEREAVAALRQMSFPDSQMALPSSRYSKGMRQKTAITIGLLKGAEVFLLDEPFSGLDPSSRDDFSATISDLRSRGKCVLFTSHDLAGVGATATHVGVLVNGELVVNEPLEEFQRRDARTIYRPGPPIAG